MYLYYIHIYSFSLSEYLIIYVFFSFSKSVSAIFSSMISSLGPCPLLSGRASYFILFYYRVCAYAVSLISGKMAVLFTVLVVGHRGSHLITSWPRFGII